MKKLTVLIAAFAAIAALALPTLGGAAPPKPGGAPSKGDKLWLTKALQIDLFEIKSGELGQTQGTSSVVTKLGETLSRDHAEAAARDKPRAKKLGATVPTKPSATMTKELKTLAAAKGSKFDEAFVKAEIKGHEKAIEGAEAEIASGKSVAVVRIAKVNLKMYIMHLRMAQAAR
jgi:putative membrane protein